MEKVMANDESTEIAEWVWPPALVPLDRFDVTIINAYTAELTTVDIADVNSVFARRFATAQVDNPNEAKALQLLAGVTSIILNPSDKGTVWGARWTDLTSRSPLPEDIQGEQSAVLGQLAGLLAHHGLRAHLADIVWTNDRKLIQAANLAIEAYCECAERLLEGGSNPRFHAKKQLTPEVLRYVERALQLANQTRKKGAQPERVVAALRAVYAAALNDGEPIIFVNAANLGFYYRLFDASVVAADAEAVATKARAISNPMAAAEALDLAGQLYNRTGDLEGERRCRLANVDQILAMRSYASGAGAEAHWVQTALFGDL
jgi:hypothetical protein